MSQITKKTTIVQHFYFLLLCYLESWLCKAHSWAEQKALQLNPPTAEKEHLKSAETTAKKNFISTYLKTVQQEHLNENYPVVNQMIADFPNLRCIKLKVRTTPETLSLLKPVPNRVSLCYAQFHLYLDGDLTLEEATRGIFELLD